MKSNLLMAICAAMLAGTCGVYAQGGPSEMAIGPDYYWPAPQAVAKAGVPQGAVHEFVMDSRDSKYFPGVRQLDNDVTRRRDSFGNRLAAPFEQTSEKAPYQRHVAVYVPKQYVPGTPAPFIMVQDGQMYANLLPNILDNLIAAKSIPVMIAVMIDSGGGDAQGSERGVEYDTMSGHYAEFVESEVLPRVMKETGVTLTKDPEGRATMGGSSGAAAAFTMAWFHPELYHRVLSYSGTYDNQQSPADPAYPHGAWEYHEHLIPQSPKKPLRVWLEVGQRDHQADQPEFTFHNTALANQNMAAALRQKGYPYRFVFARDAGHVDTRVVGQTLPGALQWLWETYPR